MDAAQKKAQQMIDSNGVMVFSKSYCPYCRNTKRILDGHGAKYQLYELNQEGSCPGNPPAYTAEEAYISDANSWSSNR